MKRTSLIAIAGVILPAMALAGCNLANQSTVDRITPIPQVIVDGKKANGESGQSTPPDSNVREGAVAIHLDAQQRLLLASARGYCAEPSPDAFSAYVGSLGLGKSATTEAAVSLATALQQSAGSIGLRTQSITLMRDALYRMCEAANNDKLTDIQVARFLRRSQDLTAVVLAIEQLTGAVAASQVILTPQSSADASANLVAEQQLLDEQKQRVETLRQEFQSAQTDLTATQEIRNTKEIESNGKQEALTNAKAATNPPTGPEELERIKTEAGQAKTALENAEKDVERAQARLTTKEEILRNAEEVLEAIQASRNAALTSASASTQSTGQFSSVTTGDKLDSKSTEAIANAVKEMVIGVVEKDDTAELCLLYLISGLSDQRKGSEEVSVARVAEKSANEALLAATQKVYDLRPAEMRAEELYFSLLDEETGSDDPALRNAISEARVKYHVAEIEREAASAAVKEARRTLNDRRAELQALLGLSRPGEDGRTAAGGDDIETVCRDMVRSEIQNFLRLPVVSPAF